jgi:hypothetical protein
MNFFKLMHCDVVARFSLSLFKLMRFKWKLQSCEFIFFKSYVLASDAEITSMSFTTYDMNQEI